MKCLSVETLYAYQICFGFKDVENRNWKTDYRGPLYIHASGKLDYLSLDVFNLMPKKRYEEIMKLADELYSRYGVSQNNELNVKEDLKRNNLWEKYKCAYNFVNAIENYGETFEQHYGVNYFDAIKYDEDECDNFIRENKNNYLLKARRIIGKVNLIDIIKNSKSPFAEKNCYHWVLEDPVLFSKPYVNVNGKLRLWDCSHIVNN